MRQTFCCRLQQSLPFYLNLLAHDWLLVLVLEPVWVQAQVLALELELV